MLQLCRELVKGEGGGRTKLMQSATPVTRGDCSCAKGTADRAGDPRRATGRWEEDETGRINGRGWQIAVSLFRFLPRGYVYSLWRLLFVSNYAWLRHFIYDRLGPNASVFLMTCSDRTRGFRAQGASAPPGDTLAPAGTSEWRWGACGPRTAPREHGCQASTPGSRRC